MTIKVEYIDHMGDDLRVVNAARVSFDKESELIDGHMLSGKDGKLLNYLAKHGHFTPFTHPMITLRETVPIFVARQRFKHVVGFTYNEVSRRYVDDEPEFFTPDVWRTRPEGSVKQGSGAPIDEGALVWTCPTDEYRGAISRCKEAYQEMLACGVAPEQARMVLPQSMMTSYYVTGSLAAFARAYKLREDGHAQKEIQDLAHQWDKIIRPLFPHSWEALTQ
ncbi:FAD-dependent thymidylate synthase [Vreelandella massiliensis]|uniref:FAD-dependent thymidylate synthase n=1 Tax=Vreelandella massiliensis TaxID=1816686 RepID=UPI00096A8ED2|nr:FAD-dependent thymidylate synthase [Halomonas massiliensis]